MDGGREILLDTCRGHHHVARLVIRSVEAAGTLAPVGKESVSKPEMFSKVKVTSNSLTTSAGLLSLLRQQSVSLDGFRNGFTRCKLGRKRAESLSPQGSSSALPAELCRWVWGEKRWRWTAGGHKNIQVCAFQMSSEDDARIGRCDTSSDKIDCYLLDVIKNKNLLHRWSRKLLDLDSCLKSNYLNWTIAYYPFCPFSNLEQSNELEEEIFICFFYFHFGCRNWYWKKVFTVCFWVLVLAVQLEAVNRGPNTLL